MTELSNIKELVGKVDGWLALSEGELLYHLAKNCTGKGVIAEIGSWKGKSTIWLARGSLAGNRVKVYAIDPHTGSSEHTEGGSKNGENVKVWTFPELQRNIEIAGVKDIVTPIVKTSEEAAKGFDQPIEMIFIDGAHEYNFVKLDFKLWFPKVIEGGIIAFHDTTRWPGPRRLVRKLTYCSKYLRNFRFVESVAYAEKVRRNSLQDRLRNVYSLLVRDRYEFVEKYHIPKPLRLIGKKVIKLLEEWGWANP